MLPIDAARTNELHSDCLNVCLPSAYKTELDEESKEGLELALGGLRAAAAAGDLSRGANFHCSALRRHLALKHALSDAARVEVIEILYRLVTADVPVAHGVRRRWAVALCKLLRRAKHLDFVLPWRPLLSQLLLYSTSKLRIAQFASRSIRAPIARIAAAVASTSSPSSSPSTRLSPTASADSISDRCDMLLSPGTVTLPERGGAVRKVIGIGWSSVWVTNAPCHGTEKISAAFDSGVCLWQGAPRFAGDQTVAPRDFCLSIEEGTGRTW